MSAPTVPSPDDKRAALDAVLQSTPFVRAEQLRSFLRYVCEMELAGRGGELNEYLIGVEALGRPPGYSPAEDATVRRRAHDLRDKLEEAYATELGGAALRIDLPKGRYIPRFVAAGERRAEDPGGDRPRHPRVAWVAAGSLLLGLAVGAAAALLSTRSAASMEPVLAEAWGPLAQRGASLTIAVAAPAHYSILPYPGDLVPPGVRLLPEEWGVEEWYRRHYPLPPGQKLGVHVAGPLRTGEVMGLVAATRRLAAVGADYQVVVDGRLSLPAVRGRNLLLFANPEYSELAAALLERGVWTVEYDPVRRARVVRPRQPDSPHATYAPGASWQRPETYGLLTVLANDGAVVPNGATTRNRAVVVSCTHSQGCQAAMEFFGSASHMLALRSRFRQEGQAGFPEGYQVVVRCLLHRSQALAGEYQAHAVLR
jgi:hypothetical protein